MRKVALGLGNTLGRDEGLGVHALRALSERLDASKDVELVDGGVLGLRLLPIVEACSHLLVLDAIDAGQVPGTVLELSRDEIPRLADVKLSVHQVSFQEVLALAEARGRLPSYLHVIGAQPEDISVGVSLSPSVERALPTIVGLAAARLEAWGLTAVGPTP